MVAQLRERDRRAGARHRRRASRRVASATSWPTCRASCRRSVIAELMGIPLDDGRALYRLTERMHTATPTPESPARRAGGRRRDADVRGEHPPREARAAGRRHRERLARRGGRRREAHRHRVRHVLPAADQRRRRHDAQPRRRRHARADRGIPTSARGCAADPDAAAVGAIEEMLRFVTPGGALPAHRDARCRDRRPAPSRRATRW